MIISAIEKNKTGDRCDIEISIVSYMKEVMEQAMWMGEEPREGHCPNSWLWLR